MIVGVCFQDNVPRHTHGTYSSRKVVGGEHMSAFDRVSTAGNLHTIFDPSLAPLGHLRRARLEKGKLTLTFDGIWDLTRSDICRDIPFCDICHSTRSGVYGEILHSTVLGGNGPQPHCDMLGSAAGVCTASLILQ